METVVVTGSAGFIGRNLVATLFWASEPFDPQWPDTHALPV
ncbi:hypothetical protein [Geothrix edaphica]|uniref:NAD-dependent epimerase/dehydratase family protein n=1 Tax=Geothrix edaphica TaxID=2927976 RepID=A0ABQ5PV71_9BACT|nr:hypothetical protein [Geothrix edaphica]GLH66282.1 hypothetical protein GETHED_06460 [Geothrix edaphica]